MHRPACLSFVTTGRRLLVLLVVVAFGALAVASGASAATFTVNSPTDVSGIASATTCPSMCTLREAVQAADALGGSSTISLPAGDYKLMLANPNTSESDNPAVGDLDVDTGVQLTITGTAGAGATTIDAKGIADRAFAVQAGGSLALTGVTITNGSQSQTGTTTGVPGSYSLDPGVGAAARAASR
jgi:CSLREA domain-containing protein